MNVVILDTGCANLNSVKSAIARHGYEPKVSRDPDVVLLADKLFLPGVGTCLLYTSPSPRDRQKSRMPSSA